MVTITKESFEATIASLLNANPRNSAKGNDMKDWFQNSFSLDATVSHVKEDKQIGNRIAEQFKHKATIVVFVCNSSVNRKTLLNRALEQRYAALNTLLIIGYNGTMYSYERLCSAKSNAFTKWAENTLNVTVELIEDNNDSRPNINQVAIPHQQIFYGAPGTGKSNTIKRYVDDKNKKCFRTTFHPDSDYSTFVGAYKPSMDKDKNKRKFAILDYEGMVDKFKEYIESTNNNITQASVLFGYDYHDSIVNMLESTSHKMLTSLVQHTTRMYEPE